MTDAVERVALGIEQHVDSQPLLGCSPSKLREIRARKISQHALSTLRPGDRLPGGLVVVPEEATGSMVSAGGEAIQEHCDLTMDAARKAYTAMIAAAGKEG